MKKIAMNKIERTEQNLKELNEICDILESSVNKGLRQKKKVKELITDIAPALSITLTKLAMNHG